MTDVLGPGSRTDCGLGMSNFDYEIDLGLEERLRNEHVFGTHAAWDHWGVVWFENGLFHEEVWVHRNIVGTWSAETLGHLMDKVNDLVGWD